MDMINNSSGHLQAQEMLKTLSFADVQKWIKALRTNIVGSAKFSEVVESLDGRGPRELWGVGGDEEGLAFGRGKHITIRDSVTNKQMGEARINAWMIENPDVDSREQAVAALTAGQAPTKVLQLLRSAGRGLMAYMCSCIEEELLLILQQDPDFERARIGHCAVALVEAMLNRAANKTQVPRIDRIEGERNFQSYRMINKEYWQFKKQTNLNYINCLRAGSEMSGMDAVGTIVSNSIAVI